MRILGISTLSQQEAQQTPEQTVKFDWRLFTHPRVVTMLFLGISAGLPLLLIFSSLSLWLREAGVERAAVTFFSWAALGYSFKFVWAPLIDKLPVPILSALLGRRRSWMLVAQFSIAGALSMMAFTNPALSEQSLSMMAIAAVWLGFSSATQDIVIDAFRIEAAPENLQAMLSASYTAGYRVGMLLSGAGALYLASLFGSELGTYSHLAWQKTYLIMAALMSIGVVTTLIVSEPSHEAKPTALRGKDNLGILATFAAGAIGFVCAFVYIDPWLPLSDGPVMGFVWAFVRLSLAFLAAGLLVALFVKLHVVNHQVAHETYVAPMKDFFTRYGVHTALLLLSLVGLYRISDIVLGVVANVFYQDLGFTKNEIAGVVKTFGLFMTILGGFLGGVLCLRFGVMRILMLGALLTVLTNLTFVLLAIVGHDIKVLYLVISADNLTAGLAASAFIAFLSALTNVQFTATQYAVFSSLMTLIPKLIGGYSGTMVDSVGYINFFFISSIMGLPVLWLVWRAKDRFKLTQ